MEVLMQGLVFFNVQFGMTNLRVFSQGNCVCGARSEENSRVSYMIVSFFQNRFLFSFFL